jgi:hypothetical protein
LRLDITQQQVEEIVLKDAIVTKWLEVTTQEDHLCEK